MNYIKPIEEELTKTMHKHCMVFVTIGTPIESPRWYNLREVNNLTNEITIGSTQVSRCWFKIQPPYKNHIEFNEFWSQFKVFRTNFLKENYPTISLN